MASKYFWRGVLIIALGVVSRAYFAFLLMMSFFWARARCTTSGKFATSLLSEIMYASQQRTQCSRWTIPFSGNNDSQMGLSVTGLLPAWRQT